jgi:hypothetical protein
MVKNQWNELCVENIWEVNPCQESLEGLQASTDKTRLDQLWVSRCLLQYPVAKFKDLIKVSAHYILEFACLLGEQGVFREIENFFGQKFENVEGIFTSLLTCPSIPTNVRNEVGPSCSPLMLNDRDQGGV